MCGSDFWEAAHRGLAELGGIFVLLPLSAFCMWWLELKQPPRIMWPPQDWWCALGCWSRSRIPSGVKETLYQSWTACLQIFPPERKTSFCEVTPRLSLNYMQMHQTLNNARGFILTADWDTSSRHNTLCSHWRSASNDGSGVDSPKLNTLHHYHNILVFTV